MYRPVCAAIALMPCVAYGAAFQLFEHGAATIGTASTNQAEARDASGIFWNPASLSALSDRSATGAFHLILPTGQLANTSATTTIGSSPISGNNGGSPGSLTPAASLYFARQASPDLFYGLTITAPFGLGAHYDDGWQGRYHALQSGLINLDIGLSGAYRLNEKFTIGAGLDIQYARAMFSSAVDLSTVCLGTAASVPGLNAQCTANGFATPGNVNADGKSTVTGDSWAPGWNVGLMWRPSSDSRIGLAYRSKVTHHLRGRVKNDKPGNLPSAVANLAALTDTGISSTLVLPESASVSGYVQATDRIGLMASATWVRWSHLAELRTHFANGAADSVVPLGWENTWRVGGGISYRASPTLTWRAGLAFDQSPTTSSTLQTLLVPDVDRWVAGLGASYALADKSSIDVGYAVYVFRQNRIESNTSAAGTFSGVFPNSYIHALSIQYNTRF